MGKVIMSGIVPQLTKPAGGLLASELAVGSTVKLMENGSPIEYLVVNQGIPSDSTLYDDSCDGTWLLRKDIIAKMIWGYTGYVFGSNGGGLSTPMAYLEDTFIPLFDEATNNAIKTAKIPYYSGTNIKSGADGHPCKAFVLSMSEFIGYSNSNKDGDQLTYFESGEAEKRIANYNGTATQYWTRTVGTQNGNVIRLIRASGSYTDVDSDNSQYGVRPALILHSNTVFDEETLILKGVA